MTVFFKLRNRQKAISGLNTLRSLQDPAAHKLAEKLDALSATLDAHEAAKQALENALRDYNISVAEQEIEKLQVSPSQRSILKAYLNMYRGRFDEARSELNSVSTTNYAIVQEGLDTLSKAEVNYRSLSEKAYSFLYSPVLRKNLGSS